MEAIWAIIYSNYDNKLNVNLDYGSLIAAEIYKGARYFFSVGYF